MHNQDPSFKSVFGSAWNKLPPVFKKRYANRPYSQDITTVEGKMDINFSKIMACLLPIFRLLHVLVPYKGKNIPAKVNFCSRSNSNAVYFERKFYLATKKQPYQFNSRMDIIKENEVIERMALGMGWKTHYFYDGHKIIMQHKAYVLRIFGLEIRLPLELLMGVGHAEEEAIDDNSYRVSMTIKHPLFGIMYSYAGDFTFTRLPL